MGGQNTPDDGLDPLEARPDVWYELDDQYENNYAVRMPGGNIRYYKTRRGASNRVEKQYSSRSQAGSRRRATDPKRKEEGSERKQELRRSLVRGM